MSDFTKEELESIANWGDVYTEFGNSWADKTERPLINKIQSMIDSYCEHAEEYEDFNYQPMRCKICQEITG